jgi:NitT/TauT family transport system substrate-binding protein
MGGWTRRCLLAGLAGLPAAARAAPEAIAPVAITVVCPNVSNTSNLAVLNAVAGGHFAAQGLQASIVGSGTGVGALQQLAAGRCQFLRAQAIELIRAVARQQAPLVAIACDEHSIQYVMLSAPDRPVRDASGLRGKRVGLLAVGSTMDNYLDVMLHHAGLPLDAVERRVIGMNAGAFELVRLGRLDAIILPHEAAWPLLHPSVDAAAEPIVVLPISLAVAMPGHCLMTTRAIAEQRSELALGFVRAMAASMLEIIAGPIDAVVARCAARFDMPGLGPMAQSVAIVQWQVETWLADGRAALLRNLEAGWHAGLAEMAEAGLATVPAGVELYTNRFVGQALGE